VHAGSGPACERADAPRQYRERIIFLGKPIDEELGNQLVATMLYLDTENKKPIQLYINCTGGDVRAPRRRCCRQRPSCAWAAFARPHIACWPVQASVAACGACSACLRLRCYKRNGAPCSVAMLGNDTALEYPRPSLP